MPPPRTTGSTRRWAFRGLSERWGLLGGLGAGVEAADEDAPLAVASATANRRPHFGQGRTCPTARGRGDFRRTEQWGHVN
jgi:hypothetical protein